MRAYKKEGIGSVIHNAIPKPLVEFNPEDIEVFKTYSQVLLGLLVTTGLFAVSAVAPNALQALKVFFRKKHGQELPRKEQEQKLIKTFYYLKYKGYIDFQKEKFDYQIVIHKKGKDRHNQTISRYPVVEEQKPWDGKFWQVAADIPTDYRMGADMFRRKIKSMGFYPLQRTLWFYPYDPRNEVELLARDYGIWAFVTIMKVEIFQNEDLKVLKNFFTKKGII